MLTRSELRKTARARLQDAGILYRSGRWDGAYYMSGYAIELRLKARVCDTLNWPSFPETNREFKGLDNLKTHDLDRLLRFSGRERQIKATHLARWSTVRQWNPVCRYGRVGSRTQGDARLMLIATRALMRQI